MPLEATHLIDASNWRGCMYTGAVLGIIRMLLVYGADVNGCSGLSDTTALLEACQVGHFEIVSLLLQEGADVHAIDKYQFSALMLAAAKGHVHIARVLLSHGAHINYRRGLTKFDEEVDDRQFPHGHSFAFAYNATFPTRCIHLDDPWETALQAALSCARDPKDDPMVDLLLANGAIS